MDLGLRLRLSVMMFLQYYVWGSWFVQLNSYLKEQHGFEPGQVALIFGTTAIGAMISPFFVGLFADRFFATEKILAVLHGLGGILLIISAGSISTATANRRLSFT